MYIFRLHRGDDLKNSILEFCRMNNINSGIMACAVGCCSKVRFRLAGADDFYEDERDYEIVSITGTISKDGVHIHISFADNTGKVVGGHLTEGCIINTTCEVSIIKSDKYKLSREYDEETCYKELVIEMN